MSSLLKDLRSWPYLYVMRAHFGVRIYAGRCFTDFVGLTLNAGLAGAALMFADVCLAAGVAVARIAKRWLDTIAVPPGRCAIVRAMKGQLLTCSPECIYSDGGSFGLMSDG